MSTIPPTSTYSTTPWRGPAGGEATAAHPRTYDLLHHAGAAAHDELRDVAWPAAGAWHYRLERADGRRLLHGRLAPGERPPGVEASGPHPDG